MNNAILEWLEVIIEERFGHKFKLSLEDEYIQIRLKNDSNYISIIHTEKYYKIPNEIHGCCSLEIHGKTIAAPGLNKLSCPMLLVSENSVQINFDLLGLAYWMLNRIEEVDIKNTDGHDRFGAVNSHAFKYGYLERPIVDEWFATLGGVILRVWPGIKLKENTFSVNISHDVDQPSRYAFRSIASLVREVGVDVLRHKKFKSLFLGPWICLATRTGLLKCDPANTFSWIMDVSEKNNIKSAFYFICGGTHKKNDADYSVDHPVMRRLICDIHSRGHEIGLHPSYNCYQNYDQIVKEINTLKRVCNEEQIPLKNVGGRMHFLRWQHPLTLSSCSDAGMVYDSTLGFSDMAGFRCGTCFEYPGFDPIRKLFVSIRIRPLIVMDCTVTADRYMKLGLDAAFEKIIELKNRCREVDGQFNILWHNSELPDAESKKLYERILSN